MKKLKFFFVYFFILMIVGCGQIGPLYLPDKILENPEKS